MLKVVLNIKVNVNFSPYSWVGDFRKFKIVNKLNDIIKVCH